MRSFVKLAMAVTVACALGFQAQAVGMFDYPVSIAIDAQGDLIISEPGRHRVDKYDYGLSLKWRTGGLDPLRVAVNSQGDAFVADSNAGIKKLSAADGSVQPLGALSQVAHPLGISIDGNGFIYVLDGSAKVHKFTANGAQELGSWGGQIGSGDGEFSSPSDLAVGPGGNSAYIADTGNSRIQKWHLVSDASGVLTSTAFVGWLGRCTNTNRVRSNCDSAHQRSRGFSCTANTCSPPSPGSGQGQFAQPSGLGLNGPNQLFVADFGNSRIQEFRADGTILGTFGTKGIGLNQLTGPTDVAVDGLGDIWATDGPAGRLVKFDPTGMGNGPQIFGGNVVIAASPGSPPLNVDPIFDPRAVPVFSGSSATSTITLASTGYFGALSMTGSCCLDLATTAPVSPGGVTAALTPPSFTFAPPQPPSTANLTLSASSNPAPGKYVALAGADDPTNTFSNSVGVGFEVLPPWPVDGPAPACMPGLQMLKLSMLDMYSWRQKQATAPTIFSNGVAILSMDPNCPPPGSGTVCTFAGIQLDVRASSPPLSPGRALVHLVNNSMWGDVSVTTSDSRNCSAPVQTRRVQFGAPNLLTFTKADTTTLIFSDANGSPSIAKAQFSEGPFWSLFDGREVTITFIGNFHRP